MGYDLIRFVKEVDEEFICPICTMVLENGVQSQHCEHTYCDACIKEWLSINNICPIDRNDLELVDIKPIPRVMKNLILKLKIKCDFESNGCYEVLKLENLDSHSKVCLFNPNMKITCERKCRLEMTKSEYEMHDCLSKLSDLVLTQQKQIKKLENQLRLMITNNWISPNGLIVNNNVIECYKAYANKHKHKSLLYGNQFAQNKYPLTKSYPSVDFEIIELGCDTITGIVLTNCYKDYPNVLERNNIEYFSFSCMGGVFKKLRKNANYTRLKISTKWEIGDVITVGLLFNEQQECAIINEISIYFNRNNQLIYEEKFNINDIGLYPTFYTKSIGAKIIVN